MSQHVCNGRAFCAEKGETQVGCGPKYEVSPSPANVCEVVPPAFTDPMLPPHLETIFVIVIFAKKRLSIKIKYTEKGIVVKDVDRWSMWTITC